MGKRRCGRLVGLSMGATPALYLQLPFARGPPLSSSNLPPGVTEVEGRSRKGTDHTAQTTQGLCREIVWVANREGKVTQSVHFLASTDPERAMRAA